MSFNRLVSETSIPPTLLVYHLGKLLETGLIHREICQGVNTREYTRYRLTELGRDLLSAALSLKISGEPDKKGDARLSVPTVIEVIPARVHPRVMRLEKVE